MTPEEIKQKLKGLGIPVDEWGETKEGEVKSPLIEKQKLALGKIQTLLEHQVQQDQVRLAELHAALQRVKHGGGN